ncbi:MAG: ClpXP protease specificity-enhancing factor SspB [Polyangiaceae bacterium]
MSASTQLPPKKEVVLALLESTDVFVHLDPRTDRVKVPPWFKHQPQLVLQIGLNMPVPIPDLEVDDDAVSCTLSFNRSPFFCFVPWQSVYALVGADGRAMVWPEDVPPEVAAQAEKVEKKLAARSHLRAVDAEDESDDAEAPPEPEVPIRSEARASKPPEPEPEPEPPAPVPSEDKGKKLPPYLRVVK